MRSFSNDPVDAEEDDATGDEPPNPFADLPPPPGSQPSGTPGQEVETPEHRSPVGSGMTQRGRASADAASHGGEQPPHREAVHPATGLRAALQWTVRFFQIQRPGFRVAIWGTVLAGLVSLLMGLYVWPVLGLFWLLYVPAVFLLTGVTIIAAYDSLVGHQRSDWTRLMWAIRRTPAVLLSGALWASLHTFGLAMFILPGLYLYVKGLLVGPAAVLDGGVAVRPFFLSKAATRGTNLSVIGLWILTVAGFWVSVAAVGTLFPASAVAIAGEHLRPFDVKLVVGVTAGLGVFPVLAPVYTRLYALNRPTAG